MAKATPKPAVRLSDQSREELATLLEAKRADLLGYKKSLASGELKNTGILKATRKEIAQITTALAGKEGDK